MDAVAGATLDYEALVQAYESALVTHLRGKRTDYAFLEMWVPDEDPVRSILNMIEAAAAAGENALTVRVRTSTLPASRHAELDAAVSAISDVTIEAAGPHALVQARNLKG